MNRRHFLTSLAGALAGPREAQQTDKVHRIGWLGTDPVAHRRENVLQDLRDLGYTEGRNIDVTFRSPGGGWLRTPFRQLGFYTACALSVHDADTIINPMIAEGQIHGGALHSLGGALCEELRYDEAGQCITATFMDYAIPTAEDARPIEIAHLSSPSPLTPLGSKGLGDSSSMAVPARARERGERRSPSALYQHHRASDHAPAAVETDAARAPATEVRAGGEARRFAKAGRNARDIPLGAPRDRAHGARVAVARL